MSGALCKSLVIVALFLVLPGNVAAVTWTPCSSEGQWCSFTGTVTVRFGTGERWCAKTFTNGVMCTTAGTGCADPVGGEKKSCEIDPTPTTAFTLCAAENSLCNPGYKGEVRYGANSQYVFKTLPATGFQCSSAAFGTDPAKGSVKSCYYRADPATWVVQVTAFDISSAVPAATGSVTAGTSTIVNCGTSDLSYENQMQYSETETHSWSISTSHTGTVSVTVDTDVKIPMVGSVSVAVTTEYSFSQSETKDKSFSSTTTRTHTVTATIPPMKQLNVLVQGSLFTASIPWTGKMYQVDSSGSVIDGTVKDAVGYLESARTATFTVLVREQSATAACAA